MATRKRPDTKARAGDAAHDAPLRRDESWDDRLRRVGDARFIAVEWSGRDDPSWPLPKS